MRGTLASIDLNRLTDVQLARISAGEHPWSMLGSTLDRGLLRDALLRVAGGVRGGWRGGGRRRPASARGVIGSSGSTAGQSGLSNVTCQRHIMSWELPDTARVPSSHGLDASSTKGDTWDRGKQIPSISI